MPHLKLFLKGSKVVRNYGAHQDTRYADMQVLEGRQYLDPLEVEAFSYSHEVVVDYLLKLDDTDRGQSYLIDAIYSYCL